MTRGFAKLDSGIVDSTLWMQPADVLKVWIAMLAKADQAGYVRVAVPALAHLCQVTLQRIEEILAILSAPDPYSRTDADEGRRIRPVEGGWILVNYTAYRNARDPEARKEQQREWDRQHRPSGHARAGQSDTVRQSDNSPTRSDTVRRSPTHAEAEADTEAEKIKSNSLRSTPPAAPAPAQAPPADCEPIPLNDGTDFMLSADQFGEFLRLFPAVDVRAEIRKMRAWAIGNPSKRKTRRGVMRFMSSWLAGQQDRARDPPQRPAPRIAQNFADKTYTGSTDDQLPAHLRP